MIAKEVSVFSWTKLLIFSLPADFWLKNDSKIFFILTTAIETFSGILSINSFHLSYTHDSHLLQ